MHTVNLTAKAVCSDGSIRLVNGRDPYEGRVEVCYLNTWGTVCNDSWSLNDATVACRQLGYQGGTTLSSSSFREGTGPIWLDDLICTGSESRLVDCKHSGYGVHNCVHYQDAGLRCQGKLIALHKTSKFSNKVFH